MASSNDPRIQLEKLAEKQMKSVLHAKFLEDCLSDEVVPKGLELKLKVSVGNDPEDLELQESVDKLLEKTSLHVLNIVKEGHMRKVKNLGNSIEEVRGKLKKNMPHNLVLREPRYEKTGSLHMRKQRREADKRRCFRYTDDTTTLLPKSEISML